MNISIFWHPFFYKAKNFSLRTIVKGHIKTRGVCIIWGKVSGGGYRVDVRYSASEQKPHRYLHHSDWPVANQGDVGQERVWKVGHLRRVCNLATASDPTHPWEFAGILIQHQPMHLTHFSLIETIKVVLTSPLTFSRDQQVSYQKFSPVLVSAITIYRTSNKVFFFHITSAAGRGYVKCRPLLTRGHICLPNQ